MAVGLNAIALAGLIIIAASPVELARCAWGRFAATLLLNGSPWPATSASGPNIIEECKAECDGISDCHGFEINTANRTCILELSMHPPYVFVQSNSRDYFACLTDLNVYSFCRNKPNCRFNYPCSRETAECAVYEMGEMKMCFLSEEPFPWLKD
ncbi:hypothetical protein CAPTEDRAFT_191231 [Capitella teleta]|uniref:Apple domain-containing protein n=1 Tax=Capitella teleta TaxID=283909 RepID=R7TF30_CAPTE|nr:hypothetical protein CAPTEDRAFT_191231 [Capitella teleta]|eukprot:ELT92353.1 hypothetical protein CAPTEDRAFT_191231 [Capitella teleta]